MPSTNVKQITRAEFTNVDAYQQIVQCKQPILIKQLVNDQSLEQLLINEKQQLKPLYSRGAVPFLYLYFDNETLRKAIFSLPIVQSLVQHKHTKFRSAMRLWQHKSGHISPLHYDQRSTDLLNLCVHGEKRWLFAPPTAKLNCWPFFNIALPWQTHRNIEWQTVTMNAGDLLYIPRNWFHQVLTTQDDTRNINLIFNDLSDSVIADRELELAAMRSAIIPNYIYGDNIPVLNQAIQQVSKRRMLKRFIIEMRFIILLIGLAILIYQL